MIMKNRRVQLIAILSAILIVIVVVVICVFFYAAPKQKYNLFVSHANNLWLELTQFRDAYPGYGDIVYLKDAIAEGEINYIINPFSTGEYCDPYETKLEVRNYDRYLTFKCGDYVIYKSNHDGVTLQMYKVDSWSEEMTDSDTETTFVYNYYDDDGILVLDEYLHLPNFIEAYNQNEGTNIINIKGIPSSVIDTKVVYRSRHLIKEIS